MSIDAVSWVFHQDIKPATRKLVLLALADFVAQDGTVWSPLEILSAKTSLDRKTIVNAITELEDAGYLADTNLRKGHTGQLKIYRLVTEGHDDTALDKQYRKRNGSENGTVPFFPTNSTVFPHERVPFSVLDPLSEPLGNRYSVQGEELVPTSTVTSPVTNKPTVQEKPIVAGSPKVQRTARHTHATIPELKPYYAAYRLGLNGTPCTEPITDSQVKRYAKALQEMLDANYSLESITNTTAKIQKSWNSNSQGKTYTVSPESVLEHWDKYFSPAKTPTNPPFRATPLPTPAITEIDETPYTEEQHLALRKSMWDAMWIERKHAASNGYFPDYQERIAYDASTDAQKAQSRAQGYVDGFCPVFDEYLAEI